MEGGRNIVCRSFLLLPVREEQFPPATHRLFGDDLLVADVGLDDDDVFRDGDFFPAEPALLFGLQSVHFRLQPKDLATP